MSGEFSSLNRIVTTRVAAPPRVGDERSRKRQREFESELAREKPGDPEKADPETPSAPDAAAGASPPSPAHLGKVMDFEA